MKDCIIIGGGISGLSAAAQLKKAGKDFLLVEKNDCLGGNLSTTIVDDYQIDFGPLSGQMNAPEIRELVEFAGLSEDLIFASDQAKNRFILKNGKLLPLPLGPGAFLTTPLFSTLAKIRLLAEPLIRRGKKEESIADFVRRRLGPEFLHYAVNPFVSGVYAGDPEKLSVEYGFPKLLALEKEFGSLFRGALLGKKTKKANGLPSGETGETGTRKQLGPRLFSFKKGMGNLPEALGQKLGKSALVNTTLKEVVSSKNREGIGVKLQLEDGVMALKTRTLLLAIPAHALDKIINTLEAENTPHFSGIPYAPVIQVFVGAPQKKFTHPLNGFGALIPTLEKRDILGVLFNSSIFPARAPNGKAGITCFLGGMFRPELIHSSEKQVEELVLRELGALLGFTGAPDLIRIKYWPKAIPQYTLGYGKFLKAMEDFEAQNPGMWIAGNHRHGISVGDCIVNGKKAAEKILKRLKEKT